MTLYKIKLGKCKTVL
jgi:phage repressor protein C with HTH and peptisase S24 domain